MEYSVIENDKPAGPFNEKKLQEMIWSGKLIGKTLVWKLGMDNWVPCESVDELKALFTPPPMPKMPAPPPLPKGPPPMPGAASPDTGEVFE